MATAKRSREAAVGTDEPRTPTHSLPSYQEPTPETHRKLSREDEAELAFKRTSFTPGTRVVLVSLFLLTIASVAVIQCAPGPWPKLNPRIFLHADEIKAFEKQLETDSVVSKRLLPYVQTLLTGKLGAGNEKVYLGRNGWLFYREDVDFVSGPGFLSPARLRQRSQTKAQPDPLKAIIDFRNQLAAREIDLLVVPMAAKATVQGEMLSARVPPDRALQNASFDEFKERLRSSGVRVFDPAPLLMERKKTGASLYLATDTHWRPDSAEFIAQQLAAALSLPESAEHDPPHLIEKEIDGVGDIARMLPLRPNEQLYPREKVTIHQVTRGNSFWRPSEDADVLVLGDSFANMFSVAALDWGESAGFVEHLSYSLGGRPLDCILRNGDGAFATREILARELARGRDRLAGKKLVIWEFAARELGFGDWKLIDLKLGQGAPPRFFSPPPGEVVEVSGTIETISAAPRPASVPYKDHIIAAQLGDVTVAGHRDSERSEAIVYLLSMQDNVWTPAARLRPGDQVRLRLRAWSDVSAEYEKINRTELDDPALQLEEPAWGELLP